MLSQLRAPLGWAKYHMDGLIVLPTYSNPTALKGPGQVPLLPYHFHDLALL